MNQSNDLFELIEKLDRYKNEFTTFSGTGGGKTGGVNFASGCVYGHDNEVVELESGSNLEYLKLLELNRCYRTTMFV